MNGAVHVTSPRPLLLDLFCGGGGAGMGYWRAGFDVIGVDLHPQKNYPFEFWQADAIETLENILYCKPMMVRGRSIAAIHASPPCQFASAMSACRPGLAETYPNLIGPTRELLDAIGLPYVIENVPLARKWMRNPAVLCGHMFGLDLYRHRLFESNMPLQEPLHPQHVIPASKAGHWRPGTIMSVSGHVAPITEAKRAMGIDWMTRDELAESIPPLYTSFIGAQLLEAVEMAA
jgi:DNA (cytosine-5)-methyltransferase 1